MKVEESNERFNSREPNTNHINDRNEKRRRKNKIPKVTLMGETKKLALLTSNAVNQIKSKNKVSSNQRSPTTSTHLPSNNLSKNDPAIPIYQAKSHNPVSEFQPQMVIPQISDLTVCLDSNNSTALLNPHNSYSFAKGKSVDANASFHEQERKRSEEPQRRKKIDQEVRELVPNNTKERNQNLKSQDSQNVKQDQDDEEYSKGLYHSVKNKKKKHQSQTGVVTEIHNKSRTSKTRNNTASCMNSYIAASTNKNKQPIKYTTKTSHIMKSQNSYHNNAHLDRDSSRYNQIIFPTGEGDSQNSLPSNYFNNNNLGQVFNGIIPHLSRRKKRIEKYNRIVTNNAAAQDKNLLYQEKQKIISQIERSIRQGALFDTKSTDITLMNNPDVSEKYLKEISHQKLAQNQLNIKLISHDKNKNKRKENKMERVDSTTRIIKNKYEAIIEGALLEIPKKSYVSFRNVPTNYRFGYSQSPMPKQKMKHVNGQDNDGMSVSMQFPNINKNININTKRKGVITLKKEAKNKNQEPFKTSQTNLTQYLKSCSSNMNENMRESHPKKEELMSIIDHDLERKEHSQERNHLIKRRESKIGNSNSNHANGRPMNFTTIATEETDDSETLIHYESTECDAQSGVSKPHTPELGHQESLNLKVVNSRQKKPFSNRKDSGTNIINNRINGKIQKCTHNFNEGVSGNNISQANGSTSVISTISSNSKETFTKKTTQNIPTRPPVSSQFKDLSSINANMGTKFDIEKFKNLNLTNKNSMKDNIVLTQMLTTLSKYLISRANDIKSLFNIINFKAYKTKVKKIVGNKLLGEIESQEVNRIILEVQFTKKLQGSKIEESMNKKNMILMFKKIFRIFDSLEERIESSSESIESQVDDIMNYKEPVRYTKENDKSVIIARSSQYCRVSDIEKINKNMIIVDSLMQERILDVSFLVNLAIKYSRRVFFDYLKLSLLIYNTSDFSFESFPILSKNKFRGNFQYAKDPPSGIDQLEFPTSQSNIEGSFSVQPNTERKNEKNPNEASFGSGIGQQIKLEIPSQKENSLKIDDKINKLKLNSSPLTNRNHKKVFKEDISNQNSSDLRTDWNSNSKVNESYNGLSFHELCALQALASNGNANGGNKYNSIIFRKESEYLPYYFQNDEFDEEETKKIYNVLYMSNGYIAKIINKYKQDYMDRHNEENKKEPIENIFNLHLTRSNGFHRSVTSFGIPNSDTTFTKNMKNRPSEAQLSQKEYLKPKTNSFSFSSIALDHIDNYSKKNEMERIGLFKTPWYQNYRKKSGSNSSQNLETGQKGKIDSYGCNRIILSPIRNNPDKEPHEGNKIISHSNSNSKTYQLPINTISMSNDHARKIDSILHNILSQNSQTFGANQKEMQEPLEPINSKLKNSLSSEKDFGIGNHNFGAGLAVNSKILKKNLSSICSQPFTQKSSTCSNPPQLHFRESQKQNFSGLKIENGINQLQITEDIKNKLLSKTPNIQIESNKCRKNINIHSFSTSHSPALKDSPAKNNLYKIPASLDFTTNGDHLTTINIKNIYHSSSPEKKRALHGSINNHKNSQPVNAAEKEIFNPPTINPFVHESISSNPKSYESTKKVNPLTSISTKYQSFNPKKVNLSQKNINNKLKNQPLNNTNTLLKIKRNIMARIIQRFWKKRFLQKKNAAKIISKFMNEINAKLKILRKIKVHLAKGKIKNWILFVLKRQRIINQCKLLKPGIKNYYKNREFEKKIILIQKIARGYICRCKFWKMNRINKVFINRNRYIYLKMKKKVELNWIQRMRMLSSFFIESQSFISILLYQLQIYQIEAYIKKQNNSFSQALEKYLIKLSHYITETFNTQEWEKKTSNYGINIYTNTITKEVLTVDPLIENINKNIKHARDKLTQKLYSKMNDHLEKRRTLFYRILEALFYLSSKIKNNRLAILQPI